MDITHRRATATDVPLLAELNHQLIADEGHRNPMTVAQLEERMAGWLQGEYAAVLFERGDHHGPDVVAYALYHTSETEIYLRQFFVNRSVRRQGIGHAAMRILLEEIWPRDKRLTVEVLVSNHPGVAFWRTVGYRDHCLRLEIMPRAPA